MIRKFGNTTLDHSSYVADRDRWTKRLKEIEAAAKERVYDQLVETMAEMRARHLQTLRVISGRALEALRDRPMRSAMDAVRALKIVISLERTIVGEGHADAEAALMELCRREQDALLVDAEDVTGSGDGEAGADGSRMVEVEVCEDEYEEDE